MSVLEVSYYCIIIDYFQNARRWLYGLCSALYPQSLHHFCSAISPYPKMVRILNVAEKNDAAKNVAEILSRGHLTRVSDPLIDIQAKLIFKLLHVTFQTLLYKYVLKLLHVRCLALAGSLNWNVNMTLVIQIAFGCCPFG